MALGSTARVRAASQNRSPAPPSKHKSTDVAQSADPRAHRTRAAIAAAFVALLHRRPYGRIRVSDVTRKARVGRATFYAHYASKDALLTAQLSQVVLPMLIAVPDAPCPIDATRLFAHVLAARPIYRSLCVGAQCAGSERIIHDALERHVARCLAARVRTYAPDAHAPGIVPRFVAGALQGLITWALEQDSEPDPARLQQAFGQLVGHPLTPAG